MFEKFPHIFEHHTTFNEIKLCSSVRSADPQTIHVKMCVYFIKYRIKSLWPTESTLKTKKINYLHSFLGYKNRKNHFSAKGFEYRKKSDGDKC